MRWCSNQQQARNRKLVHSFLTLSVLAATVVSFQDRGSFYSSRVVQWCGGVVAWSGVVVGRGGAALQARQNQRMRPSPSSEL